MVRQITKQITSNYAHVFEGNYFIALESSHPPPIVQRPFNICLFRLFSSGSVDGVRSCFASTCARTSVSLHLYLYSKFRQH